MSDVFEKTKYTPRQLQQNWENLLYGTHDLFCFCNNPKKHLLLWITEKGEPITFNKKQKQQIEKCLITTEEGDIVPEDGFQEGDLEGLFEEPFTEEDEG